MTFIFLVSELPHSMLSFQFLSIYLQNSRFVFLYSGIVFHSVYPLNTIIHLIVEGYLDCFYCLPILKKVEIAKQVSVEQNVGV